jgi:hypothetical protein
MTASRQAVLPDFIRKGPYLGAEDTPVPDRVKALARQIVATERTPFDRARALERYVRDHYQYTRTPGGVSWHEDLVDTFLFETKRGFCDHFASALAILCRQVGLPSRFVVGYREGEAVEGQKDLYLVRDDDAHAWVEVYFPEAGWIAFDPTPAAAAEELQQSWAERLTQWLKTIAAEAQSGALFAGAGKPGVMAPLLLWALLQAAVLAVVAHQAGWLVSVLGRVASGPPEDAIGRAYHEMRRRFRRLGLEPSPQQTPYEYQVAAVGLVPAAAPMVALLTDKYLLVTYGGREAVPGDAAAAWGSLAALWKPLREARKAGVRAPA